MLSNWYYVGILMVAGSVISMMFDSRQTHLIPNNEIILRLAALCVGIGIVLVSVLRALH